MSPLYFGGTDCPVCGATIPQGEPCQMCALRAQITEKDREIERLKEDATKAHGRYSRELMDMAQVVAMGRADLSASQAREREAREEARINLESAKAEAIDRDAMLARAMQAEAREREAVVRAEQERDRASCFAEDSREKARIIAETQARLEYSESALTAARKALEKIAQAPGDNIGVWCRDIARAALAPEQKG